ncbi:glutamate--cysteine ligase [Corynebacterium caspium]|uniref:glutamate--cysteine ligase n=1 Tax=Corynebacterium caspium TaxID=234828 RepID=UPI00037EB173|nr:glutamate--cysteine ligase [Corynebacterium caspium]WKD58674.1 Carboxylate-amine ligase YbdK [Corynebacterium caspium DSM 44850]
MNGSLPANGSQVPNIDFQRSPQPTLGVEWEIALVDPETRDLSPRAAEVIAEIARTNPEVRLEKEFLQNTVELVTGICSSVPQAVGELRHAIEVLNPVVAGMGLRLWASGSHPFSDFRDNPVSEKGAYNEIISRTQYWGNQMLIWGIHVHVGISHESRVWPLINALMTYYPHLLALTASSPAWHGTDTGYASNRTMLYQQLPTAGTPPELHSWQDWESYMHDQSVSGVINHTGSMHLDIRPAAQWGTIEIRVSDATSNLHELAAAVALTHCLVVHFDRMLDRGEILPTLQPWHIAENKWRAARYGMDALVITSRNTDEAWVRDELRQLVDSFTDLATELGCAAELRGVLDIVENGAAYERQRARFQATGQWSAAVDLACAEMEQQAPIYQVDKS